MVDVLSMRLFTLKGATMRRTEGVGSVHTGSEATLQMVYTPGTHQGHNLHLLAAGCLLEILLKHPGNFPKELQPTCVFYGLH